MKNTTGNKLSVSRAAFILKNSTYNSNSYAFLLSSKLKMCPAR